MRLFLDTSALIAASGSASGASREVFNRAGVNRWTLITTPYVMEEITRNLPRLSLAATANWVRLREQLKIMDDVFTADRPVSFDIAKDRPILFGALAWADALLTLDRADFGPLIGTSIYNLRVCTPGMFLSQEREAGALLE